MIICDVCGAPAVYSAVDTVKIQKDGQWLRVPVGKPKYGCKDHPVTSEALGATRLGTPHKP